MEATVVRCVEGFTVLKYDRYICQASNGHIIVLTDTSRKYLELEYVCELTQLTLRDPAFGPETTICKNRQLLSGIEKLSSNLESDDAVILSIIGPMYELLEHKLSLIIAGESLESVVKDASVKSARK